jgi:hypothetical protein
MKSSVQLWLARAHVQASTTAMLCVSMARKLRAAALGGSGRKLFFSFACLSFCGKTHAGDSCDMTCAQGGANN